MQQPPAGNPPGTPFIELQSVDSTNNYARTLLHEGLAQHGTTVFSWEQTAGKGQRGKSWLTEKGMNITMSIVVDPSPLSLSNPFGLVAMTALATHALFAKYAGEDTRIKWPNDLYWQDRKAGGILIETGIGKASRKGTGDWGLVGGEPGDGEWQIAKGISGMNRAIIGIGINVNQTVFSPMAVRPVSLKQITGKDFDAAGLAKELCAIIETKWNRFLKEGIQAVVDEYNQHLFRKNERVRLKKDTRAFEAVVREVTVSGMLRVQHSIEEEFSFGEVEWLI